MDDIRSGEPRPRIATSCAGYRESRRRRVIGSNLCKSRAPSLLHGRGDLDLGGNNRLAIGEREVVEQERRIVAGIVSRTGRAGSLKSDGGCVSTRRIFRRNRQNGENTVQPRIG